MSQCLLYPVSHVPKIQLPIFAKRKPKAPQKMTEGLKKKKDKGIKHDTRLTNGDPIIRMKFQHSLKKFQRFRRTPLHRKETSEIWSEACPRRYSNSPLCRVCLDQLLVMEQALQCLRGMHEVQPRAIRASNFTDYDLRINRYELNIYIIYYIYVDSN